MFTSARPRERGNKKASPPALPIGIAPGGAPAHALASIKRLVHGSLDNDVDRQLRMEAESFAACSMTADWAEGVTAFAEKRKPRFGEG